MNFYRALMEQPLDPGDSKYIPLYADPDLSPADPVADLAKTIEFSAQESAQLFSGFRGTGKSTELRRLRQLLQNQDNNTVVVLCEMEDYLNLTTPVDISDFLVSIAGAVSDKLEALHLLGKNPSHEGYWTRFRNFVTRTRVEIPGVDGSGKADGGAAGLKLSLKADPSFRARVQENLRGHLGALTADVRGFIEDCVKALQAAHGEDVRVVLLFDSIERIRGTAVNTVDVASSVETLFEGHADKLKLPYVHVVYTVPPWLKIKTPGVASLYDNSQQIPCVKVRMKDGEPCAAGLDALERLIRARGDWSRLLGDRAALDRLSLSSGGYLRDLFRLLQALLRDSSGRALPAQAARIELIEHDIRNSYLPLADDDAVWLAEIDRTHTTRLERTELLHQLSRYFDTHLVLAYRNGGEWWSAHPLISAHVQAQAAEARARAGQSGTQAGAADDPAEPRR